MRNEHTRAALVARRRDVIARYHNALLRAEEELASVETEDIDRATEQWDARVLSELSHADLREVVRLTEAIQRIDEGSYGTCGDCGEPIGDRRLHALPTTRICADCAFALDARGLH